MDRRNSKRKADVVEPPNEVAATTELAAAVAEPKVPKRKGALPKQPGEPPRKKRTLAEKFAPGSDYRGNCAYNLLFDPSGKSGGLCTYFQKPAGESEKDSEVQCVKTPYFCDGCKKPMHPECYYHFHKVSLGVVLAAGEYVNSIRTTKMVGKAGRSPKQLAKKTIALLASGGDVANSSVEEDEYEEEDYDAVADAKKVVVCFVP